MKKIKFNYFGAGIIFFTKEDDKVFVLLGKRVDTPCLDDYSLIGGGYENKDKNLMNTAIREVREEIKYDKIDKSKLIKIWAFHIVFHFRVYAYELENKNEINLTTYDTREIAELKWFDIKDLPKNRCYLIKHYCNKIFKKARRIK